MLRTSAYGLRMGVVAYIIIYTYYFYFWPIFGQSWAQERAQRPRLEKRYINQRRLAREIDSKAPNKLKSKMWP